ncbi:hypothetical protein F1880_009333 [Penicillium rolfsii]|nr:hypothetical protein F1880_009333 [Penicillium rolfsii]
MSDSYTSSSYYYTSSSQGDSGIPTITGHRSTTTSLTEADGTTIVRTAHQDLGQPPTIEEHRYDSTGQEQLALPGPGGSSAGGVRRITDLDEEGSSEPSAFDADISLGSGATPQFDGAAVPFGTRVVDVDTGAYDEHVHYFGNKALKHHRELRDPAGRKFTRDVEFDPSGRSGTAHERRRFENPETGTQVEKDDDIEVSEVI